MSSAQVLLAPGGQGFDVGQVGHEKVTLSPAAAKGNSGLKKHTAGRMAVVAVTA
jgi:hypothetical protein